MDAPNYPPAAGFEMPATTLQPVSVDNFSLAELKNMPEAWAIITKHLPEASQMVGMQFLRPYLGNFTIRTGEAFSKAIKPEAIAAIDAELKRLPPVQSIAP